MNIDINNWMVHELTPDLLSDSKLFLNSWMKQNFSCLYQSCYKVAKEFIQCLLNYTAPRIQFKIALQPVNRDFPLELHIELQTEPNFRQLPWHSIVQRQLGVHPNFSRYKIRNHPSG
jgi:hypothetical protein